MIKKWMPQYQGKPMPPDEIDICPKCGGTGLSTSGRKCPKCKGTKKRIFRLLDADESEECILNTIIEAIKTSEKGLTL